MEKEWVKIRSDSSTEAVHILQAMLEAEGIRVVVINKRDHSYQMFGEAELYVHHSDAEQALTLINTHKNE
jgi:hypothetical protein